MTGDVADGSVVAWAAPPGPATRPASACTDSFPSATGELSPVAEVADVVEYEVEADGSYRWTMWAWTGTGVPPIPRQERRRRDRPDRPARDRIACRSPRASVPAAAFPVRVTSRVRATRRGAGARRRGSCPCRGRGRPTSSSGRAPNSRSSTSSIRLANRSASFWVLPTPPGNRLSPVKTCVPASSGPAPDQRDAARRVPAQVDDLERLPADGHRVAVLDGPLHRAPAGRRRRRGGRPSPPRSPRRPRAARGGGPSARAW